MKHETTVKQAHTWHVKHIIMQLCPCQVRCRRHESQCMQLLFRCRIIVSQNRKNPRIRTPELLAVYNKESNKKIHIKLEQCRPRPACSSRNRLVRDHTVHRPISENPGPCYTVIKVRKKLDP